MRSLVLLALLGLVSSQKAGPYTAEAEADKIVALPGAESSKLPYGFSGYLSINGTAPGSKKMHYWLVESLSDPLNDPVGIWTNGGVSISFLRWRAWARSSLAHQLLEHCVDAGKT